jgi:RHS repeat-associated protein
MQYILPTVPANQPADPAGAFVPCYDIAGHALFQRSMDAGDRWTLNDAAGRPFLGWDVNHRRDAGGAMVLEQRAFFTEYDALHRRTASFATGVDPADATRTIAYERIVYGDSPATGVSLAQRKQANLLGKTFREHDTAGVLTYERFDFKGNLLRSSRRLTAAYRNLVDWDDNPALETETFASATWFDAINRRTQYVAPHSNDPGTTVDVLRPRYNAAGLLEGIGAWLERPAEPAGLLDPSTATRHLVTNIDYDARRQRTRIDYDNGVSTTYAYEPLTFRLRQVRTLRGGDVLQDLSYTYDPMGNVTEVRDAAQNAVFHSNACVVPGAKYVYDASYRLVAASGREHRGGDTRPGPDDQSRRVAAIPNDCQALRNYVEGYGYDAVGNILHVTHHLGLDPTAPGAVIWSRSYQYALDSNRLLATSLPGEAPQPAYVAAAGYSARIEHDLHGNMVAMPHLPVVDWSFRDALRASSAQAGGASATFYVYDGRGQRVRKVTERPNGVRVRERLYLGDVELFRQFQGDGQTIDLERTTLHVMDDRHRVALVETRTRAQIVDPVRRQLFRYQIADHLGSAALEVDQDADVITYEEYLPFGSSAYQAARGLIDEPKRYRYCGKERDEETGLSYHGARYYAPWLGRWASADPIGIGDGLNLYRYVSNNPVNRVDARGTDESNAHTSNFKPKKIPTTEDMLTQLAQGPKDCKITNVDQDKFKPVEQRLHQPPLKLPPPEEPKHPLKVNVSGQVWDAAKEQWNRPNAAPADKAAVGFSVGMMAGLYGFEMVLNTPDLFETTGEHLALAYTDVNYRGHHIAMSGLSFVQGLGNLLPMVKAAKALSLESRVAQVEAALPAASRQAELELAGPATQSSGPATPHVVSASGEQVKALANVKSPTSQVVWVAGDPVLLEAHQRTMQMNPTVWYAEPAAAKAGVVGYRNTIGEVALADGSRLQLGGTEIHHFQYPRSQYPQLVMDPRNLYVTGWGNKPHTAIHAAFGGTTSMGWQGIQGAEPQIQNMFNFWLNAPTVPVR